MSEDAKTGRQDAVNDLRRQLILDAARRVFEAEGLEGAGMRAIAREAGYTAGAIYFHFENKEAIYAALLGQSLDRLTAAVEAAVAGAGADPAARLRAAAMAFFDFYAEAPGDLELGFYLFRGGLRPRGLAPDLDAALNARLAGALAPVGEAAAALGADDAAARAATADAFGHAVGLLMLHHTGRIRLYRADPRALMEGYLDRLPARWQPPSSQGSQGAG
jgi:AcrR family transcriptional regulator